MTDDTDLANFPRAPTGLRPTLSTREKFDTLARRLGDPMARLFLLTNATIDTIDEKGSVVSRPDTEMQFRAAAELMPYRYPKLKASEVNHTGAVGAGVLNIQINIGSAPQATAIPSSPQRGEEVVSPVTTPVDPLD